MPAPEITEFSVSDGSSCELVEDTASFDISWDTGNADSATVTVVRGGRVRAEYSGTSGQKTFQEDGQCNSTYTFEIVAENDGGETSQQTTRTAGG